MINVERAIKYLESATEFLKAQMPERQEESIALEALNNLRIYAKCNDITWIDKAAESIEAGMGMLRAEINQSKHGMPRLLTMNEIPEHDGAVFIEYVDDAGEWALYVPEGAPYLAFMTSNGGRLMAQGDYERTWRAWTGRPTPEQRWQS